MRAITALDLGTTKFCFGLFTQRGRRPPDIETLCIESNGMRRGMLSQFDSCLASLKKLCKKHQDTYHCLPDEVVVGVSGDHLQSDIIEWNCSIQSRPIDPAFLKKVIQKAQTSIEVKDREVLHMIPLGFQIDNREITEDPIGFSGKKLKAHFFVISADIYYLQDVVRLCNSAGLRVLRLYAEPFASASVTLTDEQKARGAILADIGGGTTDGVVFVNGKPCDLFSVNIGGHLMTKDISLCLEMPMIQAEQEKLRLGLMSNQPTRPILEARVHEWLKSLLHETRRENKHVRSIHLTGGGAQLSGLTDYLGEVYNLNAVLSYPTINPQEPSFCQYKPQLDQKPTLEEHRLSFDSKYATTLGLLNLELAQRMDQTHLKKHLFAKNYLSSFMQWLTEAS